MENTPSIAFVIVIIALTGTAILLIWNRITRKADEKEKALRKETDEGKKKPLTVFQRTALEAMRRTTAAEPEGIAHSYDRYLGAQVNRIVGTTLENDDATQALSTLLDFIALYAKIVLNEVDVENPERSIEEWDPSLKAHMEFIYKPIKGLNATLDEPLDLDDIDDEERFATLDDMRMIPEGIIGTWPYTRISAILKKAGEAPKKAT
jgi:hypothetical protein